MTKMIEIDEAVRYSRMLGGAVAVADVSADAEEVFAYILTVPGFEDLTPHNDDPDTLDAWGAGWRVIVGVGG